MHLPRILIALVALAALAPAAEAHTSAPALQADPPTYQGLEYTAVGPCAGAYKVTYTDACTHGPDDIEPGDLVATSGPVQKATCIGNGSSGKRVQVLYVHASDVTDRFAEQ